jgi:hypothetical protein
LKKPIAHHQIGDPSAENKRWPYATADSCPVGVNGGYMIIRCGKPGASIACESLGIVSGAASFCASTNNTGHVTARAACVSAACGAGLKPHQYAAGSLIAARELRLREIAKRVTMPPSDHPAIPKRLIWLRRYSRAASTSSAAPRFIVRYPFFPKRARWLASGCIGGAASYL